MSPIQTHDLINFLKHPTLELNPNFKKSWIYWFVLITGTQFLATIIALTANFALIKLGFSGQNSVQNALNDLPTWLFFLLLAVQAPITEEITFRLFLKPSPKRWLLSFFGLAFYTQIILRDFGLSFRYSIFGYTNSLVSTLLNSAVLTLIIFLIWRSYPKIKESLEPFFIKHFVWFFYISGLSFGLIHIQNYSGLNNLWWLAPFLILPQALVGLVISYIRVRMGFKWGVFSHSFYNTISALPVLILSFLPKETFALFTSTIENDELTKKIAALPSSQTSILGVAILMFVLVGFISFVSFVLLCYNYFRHQKNQPQN